MLENIINTTEGYDWLPWCINSQENFLVNPGDSELFGNIFVDNNLAQNFTCGSVIRPLYNNSGVFLPYVQGKISCVFLHQPEDVFSYPFNGCIMASFYWNGLYCVCHVTIMNEQEYDQRLNWKRFKEEHADEIYNLIEFKPFDVIKNININKEYVYGLITSNGEKYSIVMKEGEGADIVCPHNGICAACNFCRKHRNKRFCLFKVKQL